MTGRFKILIIAALFTAFAGNANAQQTIQFSQYVFNGLALNPAYAGYKEDVTLNLSNRLQWTGINGAPQTGTTSIDGLTNSANKNVGLGLLATLDHLGPENISSAYVNYAYRLRLDELDTKRLSFGIAAGAVQYSIDGSKFITTDAGDGDAPTGTQSRITPDFRFGVYYYSPAVYFGASVFNLLSTTVVNSTDHSTIITPARTFYVTGGTLLPLSEFVDIKPSFLIKEDFKGPTNIDLTGYIVFNKRVWLGASYRTGIVTVNNSLQYNLDETDAVAAIAQFYISDHFRIGYSFDFTLSKLTSYQNGSHEISLSISFPGKKQRVISPRYF